MIFKVSIGLVILVCAAVWAADITPLDVKLGQWESTVTSQMTGIPPIPPEVLDKLPPEQRAKMEERMKAMGARGPRSTTAKSCLKKEDLDKAMTFGADDKACTRTVVSSSSSKQEIRIECNRNGMKQTGTVRIEASNSENVKGAVQFSAGDANRTMNVNSSFTAKWLGPTCEKEN